jgi:hypothetical protein
MQMTRMVMERTRTTVRVMRIIRMSLALLVGAEEGVLVDWLQKSVEDEEGEVLVGGGKEDRVDRCVERRIGRERESFRLTGLNGHSVPMETRWYLPRLRVRAGSTSKALPKERRGGGMKRKSIKSMPLGQTYTGSCGKQRAYILEGAGGWRVVLYRPLQFRLTPLPSALSLTHILSI